PQTSTALANYSDSTDRLARIAVAQPSPDSLRVLLDHGLDPNYKLGHSGNLLGHAVRSKRPSSVECLMSTGADPCMPFTGYQPVIAQAAGSRQQDVVELLMKHGAVLKNSLALHAAARNSTVEITEWLIEMGADVNEMPVEDEGTWARREELADRGQDWNVVKQLLERGADKGLKDAQERTVLERGGNEEGLRRLLEEH
ncbi:MAG: hypothetical protein Q9187_002956, partial [Circinaria calcarea]